jgi:hypothetical protein
VRPLAQSELLWQLPPSVAPLAGLDRSWVLGLVEPVRRVVAGPGPVDAMAVLVSPLLESELKSLVAALGAPQQTASVQPVNSQGTARGTSVVGQVKTVVH